ncbi:hypothetical protein SAMN04488120_103228 [Fontimonas thermophila]|uniref:PepSY-associated TM region n=1 Tax=Fontimonas thermophila TaxID=1076937 RepID=A0A1I2ICT0_9GAMM|nr:PepSY-associated TM helix domain-containing protein [Fontimonas thermophila]SFF40085.1 hypothetical protein SAMN04488120_103228 [Fontimonas thermophila]
MADDKFDAERFGRRALWLKHLHRWHWISSALCLTGLLFFAFTGITLNHAAQIDAKPRTDRYVGLLPQALVAMLGEGPRHGYAPLPTALRDWLSAQWAVRMGARPAEWSADEIYLSLPRPGGDAWLSIDRSNGAVEYELTDRGWIAYLNDLHKGRNTGPVWRWFIDLFALVCLISSVSGLLLLRLHAAQRIATWPTVGLGFVVPLLLALLFIH